MLAVELVVIRVGRGYTLNLMELLRTSLLNPIRTPTFSISTLTRAGMRVGGAASRYVTLDYS
jgi:hypothetical protein